MEIAERLEVELAGAGETPRVDRGAAPPSRASAATVALAASSSRARKTPSGLPSTAPARSVPANTVLNALTTRAPSGATSAMTSAPEPNGVVSSGSRTLMSTRIVTSTTNPPVERVRVLATRVGLRA